MKVLAHFNHNTFHSSCWGYSVNEKEYAIYGWYDGTSIVDITEDNNIREIFYIAGKNSGWREMKIYRNYLYIVSEADSSGIQIVDLSKLPLTVSLLNTYYFPGYKRAHTISISGHYLFINGGNYKNGGIAILDLEPDPVNPVKLGEWEEDYVHDCRIYNDTIWACNPLTGKVSVIDASNKHFPVTISNWVNGRYPVPHNCDLSIDKKYLFVCDENFEYPGKVKIWDISNKNDIIFKNEWSFKGTNESVHNIEIKGNYAYISYYGEGAVILDLNDPVNPEPVAWYKTSACWQVYSFNSGKIIASDIYDGLYVLKTNEPISVINNISTAGDIELFLNYPNPFNPFTNFRFQISAGAFVKLIIYDALGREVKQLLNQNLNPGIHQAEWDASEYPGGVYFYRLIVEKSFKNVFSETKKLVLLK